MPAPTVGLHWPIDQSPSSVTYTAENQATIVNRLFGFGIDRANRGVLRGVLNELKVTQSSPTARSVRVDTGYALVNGRMMYVSTAGDVTLATNTSGNPRYDYIVAEYKSADYPATMEIVVIQGSPAASPSLPALTQTSTHYQIPLAYVYLVSGYTTVVNSNITDDREWANVPDSQFMEVTNNSAAVRNWGEVVIWDTTANRSVTTTTALASPLVAGIIERRASIGGTARIQTSGLAYVVCNESVSRGDGLETSSTAGQARRARLLNRRPFGVVVEANSGAGTACLARIDCRGVHAPLVGSFFEAYTASATQVVVANTWTKIAFNAENTDTLSEYDTSTYRWTATANEYMIFTAGVHGTPSGTGQVDIGLYKNGSLYRFVRSGAHTLFSGSAMSIGTYVVAGDYFEAWGRNVTGTTLNLNSGQAWFSGCAL